MYILWIDQLQPITCKDPMNRMLYSHLFHFCNLNVGISYLLWTFMIIDCKIETHKLSRFRVSTYLNNCSLELIIADFTSTHNHLITIKLRSYWTGSCLVYLRSQTHNHALKYFTCNLALSVDKLKRQCLSSNNIFFLIFPLCWHKLWFMINFFYHATTVARFSILTCVRVRWLLKYGDQVNTSVTILYL